MANASSTAAPSRRAGSGYLIAEGVGLMVLGIAAVTFPGLAGIATAVLFGWILIAAGVMGLVGTLNTRPHVHLWWSLTSSLVAIAAGLVAAVFPLAGALSLVIVISAWLLVDGVSSLMIGLHLRRTGAKGWVWSIVSAVVDWLLAAGLLLLSPLGGVLAVGIVIGVDLFFGGLALFLAGLAPAEAAS